MHADLSTQTPTVTSPDAHKKWRHPPDLKTQCQHPNAIVSACGHAPHFAFGEPRPRRIAEAHFEACGGRGSDVRDCGSVVQGPGETCRHEEHAPRRQHLLRGAGPVTAAVKSPIQNSFIFVHSGWPNSAGSPSHSNAGWNARRSAAAAAILSLRQARGDSSRHSRWGASANLESCSAMCPAYRPA